MTESFKTKIFKWMAAGKADWKKTTEEIRGLQIDDSTDWGKYFNAARKNLLNGADFEQMICEDATLKGFSLEDLRKKNLSWFAEVRKGEEGYEKCFANPDYAVKTFELKLGQLMSAIYSSLRQGLYFVRRENYAGLLAKNKFFLELVELWQADKTDYDSFYAAFKKHILEDFEMSSYAASYINHSPNYGLFREIIENADFSDLRYLYRFGMYVDPQAEKLCEFTNNYPEDELQTIAKNHVAAYIKSFGHKKLDYTTKKYAKIVCPIGMEKLAFYYGEELKKVGLEPVFGAPQSKGANEQFGYDHRFQTALYLDQDFADKTIEAFQKAVNEIKADMRLVSGTVIVWLFGEEPFVPQMKETAIQMSEEQDKIMHGMQNKRTGIYFEAAPRSETSFSIISFPSTEIGENFEAIFKDTLELNNLDSGHYEKMQENMIEILDESDYVEVKGVEGNETNIRVQLPKLKNPADETNFINCGADVNIPVGEIFTSPKLTGTNGVLHVDDIYLFGLRYFNLKITFKDGMITDYTCTNYDNEEENIKYMFDNLLKPNKTLPIGEFAIGTNTLAYQMAQKHDIQHLLPILIAEKMGPHFAIGDTCFAHEEDSYQTGVISGKKMVATENEMSALRKTDPAKAYTHKHVDITLPYDMLAEITAVKTDGTRVPIILDGLFVVPGTEDLNIPLKQMREN